MMWGSRGGVGSDVGGVGEGVGSDGREYEEGGKYAGGVKAGG